MTTATKNTTKRSSFAKYLVSKRDCARKYDYLDLK